MRGVRRPPRSAGRARTSQADPTLAQIREFFHLPVEEASEQLGVNKSKLKRLCRENGVSRWPQRKLQSLVALRQHIQNDDRLLPQDRQAVLSRLEQQWAAVLEDPDKPLEREFEDMRKNLYKVRYQKRKQQRLSSGSGLWVGDEGEEDEGEGGDPGNEGGEGDGDSEEDEGEEEREAARVSAEDARRKAGGISAARVAADDVRRRHPTSQDNSMGTDESEGAEGTNPACGVAAPLLHRHRHEGRLPLPLQAQRRQRGAQLAVAHRMRRRRRRAQASSNSSTSSSSSAASASGDDGNEVRADGGAPPGQPGPPQAAASEHGSRDSRRHSSGDSQYSGASAGGSRHTREVGASPRRSQPLPQQRLLTRISSGSAQGAVASAAPDVGVAMSGGRGHAGGRGLRDESRSSLLGSGPSSPRASGGLTRLKLRTPQLTSGRRDSQHLASQQLQTQEGHEMAPVPPPHMQITGQHSPPHPLPQLGEPWTTGGGGAPSAAQQHQQARRPLESQAAAAATRGALCGTEVLGVVPYSITGRPDELQVPTSVAPPLSFTSVHPHRVSRPSSPADSSRTGHEPQGLLAPTADRASGPTLRDEQRLPTPTLPPPSQQQQQQQQRRSVKRDPDIEMQEQEGPRAADRQRLQERQPSGEWWQPQLAEQLPQERLQQLSQQQQQLLSLQRPWLQSGASALEASWSSRLAAQPMGSALAVPYGSESQQHQYEQTQLKPQLQSQQSQTSYEEWRSKATLPPQPLQNPAPPGQQLAPFLPAAHPHSLSAFKGRVAGGGSSAAFGGVELGSGCGTEETRLEASGRQSHERGGADGDGASLPGAQQSAAEPSSSYRGSEIHASSAAAAGALFSTQAQPSGPPRSRPSAPLIKPEYVGSPPQPPPVTSVQAPRPPLQMFPSPQLQWRPTHAMQLSAQPRPSRGPQDLPTPFAARTSPTLRQSSMPPTSLYPPSAGVASSSPAARSGPLVSASFMPFGADTATGTDPDPTLARSPADAALAGPSDAGIYGWTNAPPSDPTARSSRLLTTGTQQGPGPIAARNPSFGLGQVTTGLAPQGGPTTAATVAMQGSARSGPFSAPQTPLGLQLQQLQQQQQQRQLEQQRQAQLQDFELLAQPSTGGLMSGPLVGSTSTSAPQSLTAATSFTAQMGNPSAISSAAAESCRQLALSQRFQQQQQQTLAQVQTQLQQAQAQVQAQAQAQARQQLYQQQQAAQAQRLQIQRQMQQAQQAPQVQPQQQAHQSAPLQAQTQTEVQLMLLERRRWLAELRLMEGGAASVAPPAGGTVASTVFLGPSRSAPTPSQGYFPGIGYPYGHTAQSERLAFPAAAALERSGSGQESAATEGQQLQRPGAAAVPPGGFANAGLEGPGSGASPHAQPQWHSQPQVAQPRPQVHLMPPHVQQQQQQQEQQYPQRTLSRRERALMALHSLEPPRPPGPAPQQDIAHHHPPTLLSLQQQQQQRYYEQQQAYQTHLQQQQPQKPAFGGAMAAEGGPGDSRTGSPPWPVAAAQPQQPSLLSRSLGMMPHNQGTGIMTSGPGPSRGPPLHPQQPGFGSGGAGASGVGASGGATVHGGGGASEGDARAATEYGPRVLSHTSSSSGAQMLSLAPERISPMGGSAGAEAALEVSSSTAAAATGAAREIETGVEAKMSSAAEAAAATAPRICGNKRDVGGGTTTAAAMPLLPGVIMYPSSPRGLPAVEVSNAADQTSCADPLAATPPYGRAPGPNGSPTSLKLLYDTWSGSPVDPSLRQAGQRARSAPSGSLLQAGDVTQGRAGLPPGGQFTVTQVASWRGGMGGAGAGAIHGDMPTHGGPFSDILAAFGASQPAQAQGGAAAIMEEAVAAPGHGVGLPPPPPPPPLPPPASPPPPQSAEGLLSMEAATASAEQAIAQLCIAHAVADRPDSLVSEPMSEWLPDQPPPLGALEDTSAAGSPSVAFTRTVTRL